MKDITVIIPARNERFLQQTVDDVFAKAATNIEVIVVLDGGDDDVKPRPGLEIISHNRPRGTRASLNEAVVSARADCVFKLDAHCRVSEDFDRLLVDNHREDWVVTLPRYGLDPDKWEIYNKYPICYERIDWPMNNLPKIGGLTPKKWIGPGGFYWMEHARKDITIDDICCCNAACWFITRKKYMQMDGLDTRLWSFHIDGVEIGMKAWMSGGALKVNKDCWHAHYFKRGKKRTVRLNWEAMRNTQHYSTWYWVNDRWPKAKIKFVDFIEKFWPMPGWPDDWQAQLKTIPKPQLMEYTP